MANYNSGKFYNKKLPEGGATYNSAPFLILILDNGSCIDDVYSILSNINTTDTAYFNDNVLIAASIELIDVSEGNDEVESVSNISTIEDSGIGEDLLQSIINSLKIQDVSYGNDVVSAPAVAFFTVDSDNILQPLGVFVTKDSRYELLPSTRDISEEIAGIHGELDFGTEFKARTLELTVALINDNDCETDTPMTREELKRLYAKYLDPTKGYRNLVFSDDVNKTYQVKYSGRIDFTQYPNWFEFTIPFKMANPFIIGSIEKTQIGSGILVNDGTYETGILIEINGPVTNPSLTISGDILSYNGTIFGGQVLSIDTEKKIVKIGNENAVSNYNGAFPLLPPGKTSIVAENNITVKWRDKWL